MEFIPGVEDDASVFPDLFHADGSAKTEGPLDSAPEDPDEMQFVIDDDFKADWYLKHLARYHAEIDLIEAQAEAAVKRVKADRDHLQRLYQSNFESYMRRRIADDPRGRKSVILLHGTCQLRRVNATFTLTNPLSALQYCLNNRADVPPELVVERTEVDTSKYVKFAKECLEETGDMLPGMERFAERQSFSISFPKVKEK